MLELQLTCCSWPATSKLARASAHHAGLTGLDAAVRFFLLPRPILRNVQAHAHFIGVDPAHRGAGLGARLYEYFFRAVKARGCTLVHAVTSPVNTASVEFHLALGFEALRVASRGGGFDEEKGVIGGGVENRQRRASTGVQAGKGAPVDSEFVHVGYDGPDDGDRVLLEKRL